MEYEKQIEEAFVDTKRKFKIINASKEDIIKQINKMGPGDYFRLRRLTPRECLRFMSVEAKDINILVGTGVSEAQLHKQSGNAIVIKTLRCLYTCIFDDEWLAME